MNMLKSISSSDLYFNDISYINKYVHIVSVNFTAHSNEKEGQRSLTQFDSFLKLRFSLFKIHLMPSHRILLSILRWAFHQIPKET